MVGRPFRCYAQIQKSLQIKIQIHTIQIQQDEEKSDGWPSLMHRMWSVDLRSKRGCSTIALHCITNYWALHWIASPINEQCLMLAASHWMTIMHYYSANVLEVGFSCPRPTYHYLWKENSIRTSDQVRQPSSNHSAHFSFANILLRQKLCKVCLPLSNISLSFDFPYTVTMFRIMYGSCFLQRNWIDEDVLWAMLFLIVCIVYSFWSFFYLRISNFMWYRELSWVVLTLADRTL